MAMVNLIDTEFRKAALWDGILFGDELYCQGYLVDKVQYFKVVTGGEAGALVVVHVIRSDEDFIWESARDLIGSAVKQSAVAVRGVYGFELLSFEAQKELKTFNYNELAQVLINTARTLKVGEQVLVKYSSAYGLLQKTLDEAWGKMTFKTSVTLVEGKPKTVFGLFSKMSKAVEVMQCPVILMVNDLSSRPLFDVGISEEQQMLLDDFLAKRAKKPSAFARELFVRDATGLKKV